MLALILPTRFSDQEAHFSPAEVLAEAWEAELACCKTCVFCSDLGHPCPKTARFRLWLNRVCPKTVRMSPGFVRKLSNSLLADLLTADAHSPATDPLHFLRGGSGYRAAAINSAHSILNRGY
jgi:hypothetical protein